MLEWLFKYPAQTWRDATLGFDNGWPLWLLGLAVAAALLLIVGSLINRPVSVGRRTCLFLLQGSVAAIVLVMLWQPVLEVEVAEQGENTVAWVVDTSASMDTVDVPTSSISTSEPQSRILAGAAAVQRLGFDEQAEFDADLYSLGASLEPISTVEQLTALERAPITNIADGLDGLLGTVGDNALAAVVLVSDGSDNALQIDAQWWQRLSSAGVPVHTVGVGRISRPDDIELSDVSLPEQAGSQVTLTATLRVTHASGGSARIRVSAGRDLVAATDIELPDGVDESVHEITIPTGEAGIRQLRFEVASNDPLMDPDLSNNVQPRVLRVVDAPRRILYVEGEPRWEYKFLRRAFDDHPGIDIVSLLRTSPNKFYRQGVRDSDELADGFPATREQLFSYDAVIIGSLEAAELSTAQQLALRDYVSVRGGSLLMLAGRHGLADGGWGRSVVSAALPVILDARLAAKTFERTRAQVLPTISGLRTSWLSLGDSFDENQAAWQSLPAVADSQSLGSVKPGAVVLLERSNVAPGASDAEPVLVSQRYGKGQTLVFGTSGTWRWQMSLNSTDQRHESFWRQLATVLVDGVVPRISISASQPVYRDSDTATLSLSAYAANFEPLQQASLPAQLTAPDGSVSTVELLSDTRRPGYFQAVVDTPLDGPYTVNAMTPLGGESPATSMASAEHWWVRESGTAESFKNTQQQDFLQRVADATGGRYLAFNDVNELTEALTQTNAALKREVSLPLWNMPIFFLGLLLAKAIEWLLRLRWKRL